MHHNNSVMLIEARRTPQNIYVFSDARAGLIDEPFVGDVNTAICNTAAALGIPTARVSIAFSAAPMPSPDITLRLKRWQSKRNKGHGHDYRWVEGDLECWLCPALFNYFDRAPKMIYAKLLSQGEALIL